MPIIGIDLGTTNSAMAIISEGQAQILENAEGYRTTPSVVAFAGEERLVGQPAKRQAITNSANTFSSVKRLIGHQYSEIDAVQLTYPTSELPDGNIGIGDHQELPQAISAMVLRKLKQDAEAKLGTSITEAVITVPAYFNDSQRQATVDAGKIAGLDVKRIINEPTAAALAYGLDRQQTDSKIAVFDLGGGTFDITILDLGDGVFEVLSTNGDTYLGGDDFDRRIVEWILQKAAEETNINLSGDLSVRQRIRTAAAQAKVELSSVMFTNISLPYLSADANGPYHFDHTLQRAEYEALIGDLIDRTLQPCRQALKDAGNPTLDTVLLVGGMTRTPAIQAKIQEIFGIRPDISINPDEAVALGAAVQAGVLGGEVTDVLLLDVCPLTLSLETMGGISTALIPRNTTIPTKKTETFTTAANNQTAVDIKVAQGERPMLADNTLLGEFRLEGIVEAPAGIPQIEVAFSIDANGILSVSAQDKGTGKEQSITIENATGLDDSEIERLVAEAEANAEADRSKQAEAEFRNECQSTQIAVDKLLADEEILAKLPDELQERLTELQGRMEAEFNQPMPEAQVFLAEVNTAMGEVAGIIYAPPAEDDAQVEDPATV